jgi:mannose-6-phosphate isomerase-like protein (cupin superfamily)
MNSPIGPGPVFGKHWGTTQPLLEFNGVELHYIKAKKDGYCSEHYHRFKWNRFIVLEGKMKVTVFEKSPEDKGEIADETFLEAGMCTDVPPEKYHIFEALEDSVALECYWVELDKHDIVRRTVGGMRGEESN